MKKTEGETTDYEDVTDNEAEPTFAAQETPKVVKQDFSGSPQEPQKVSKELFGAFSVGSINQVNSAPDHKPPVVEDTIEGRYAGVLFTTASQQEALYPIYEDLIYLKGLYDNSEAFFLFT